MRIVLDSNVVVSALFWRGTPYRLFEIARTDEQTRLATSAALLVELAGVLSRLYFAKRLGAIGKTVEQVLIDYMDSVDLVSPVATPRVVPNDPDDDQVIAAAIAARADIIVSGDLHLLAIGMHQSIRILTPAAALALLLP